MFKKTEESEWTRFSRALQSQPPQQAETVEPDEDDTVELSAASRLDDPESTREDMLPPAYARSEPAYAQPDPTYEQSAPYAEPDPLPAPAPVAAPMPTLADSAETILGEGASLEGTLRSDRSIRILGFLSGEIESKERVIVEASARVEARIVAEQVTVIGEVNGQINCAGRVEIAPTGRVTGEVTTGRLAIQEGAFFQGQLTMVPNQAGTIDEAPASDDVLDDGLAG